MNKLCNLPYPVILNLADKNIAVRPGGGKVACRKINKLLAAGVRPTVISPLLSSEIQPTQIIGYRINISENMSKIWILLLLVLTIGLLMIK